MKMTVRQATLLLDPPADWQLMRGVLIGQGADLERTPTGWFVTEDHARKAADKIESFRRVAAAS